MEPSVAEDDFWESLGVSRDSLGLAPPPSPPPLTADQKRAQVQAENEKKRAEQQAVAKQKKADRDAAIETRKLQRKRRMPRRPRQESRRRASWRSLVWI